MNVRYLYSACVVIQTDDCTVLCDPWFGEAYEGSWVQWPKIDKPLEVCGPADFVFISHVHPDHYDPQFLKQYLAQYPQAQVLIAEQAPDLLGRKLRSRGIVPLVGYQRCGETELYPEPNRANHGVNIDSALVVRRSELSVANLNDNPFDQGQIDNLLSYCPGRRPTVALLPFVGAGPWPQCDDGFESPTQRQEAEHRKRQMHLTGFRRYCQALQPKVAVPFAGQYWLHGPQLDLNPQRGMADATECHPYWSNIWVPADGGQSILTLKNNEEWDINSYRDDPYDWPTVRKALHEADWHEQYPYTPYENRYSNDIPGPFYRYEREIQVPVARLPLLKLLQSAAKHSERRFRPQPTLWICIKPNGSDTWFVMTTASGKVTEETKIDGLTPRYEVTMDARFLFGCLTRLYNWNSARIGSLVRFRAVPGEFVSPRYDLFGDYLDSLRV